MTRLSLALAALLLAAPAHADSYGHAQGPQTETPGQVAARAMMAAGDWKGALPLLEAYVAGHFDDAEGIAELGRAYDKTGDTEQALDQLTKALWIEPRNLEANLYLGELYIELHDVPKARERLAALDHICLFGCPEYRTLKRELAAAP